jgi:hypothetical protein
VLAALLWTREAHVVAESIDEGREAPDVARRFLQFEE